MKYKFDYHLHALEHGLNKKPKIWETIKSAIAKGYGLVCFTDHYPLPAGFIDPTPENDCAMNCKEYEQYLNNLKLVRKQYAGQIKILIGCEMDWLPEYKTGIERELDKRNLDYVIGSVHFLNTITDEKGKRNLLLDYTKEEFLRGIDYYKSARNLIEEYYKEVRRMVRSGLFDAVGHLDLIKKYNDGSLFSENEIWYQREILNTLKVIAKGNMVMEINTAGLSKACRSAYPSLWILKEAKNLGIGLTTGSDGHTPDSVCSNFDIARKLAKKAGYKYLTYFINRKRMEVSL